MSESLFDRLGGAGAINAAVDIFYTKVMSDGLLSPFFEGIDMGAQHRKQKAFMTHVFGGCDVYSGKSMREAHAPLVEKGLSDQHFDAVAGHLKATLEELNVDDALVTEVIDLVATTRDDVLNR